VDEALYTPAYAVPLFPSLSFKYLGSASCHDGIDNPSPRSFALLSTEYAGRFTGLKKSLVLHDDKLALMPAHSKMCRVNSYHEHWPSELK
jgi:hypothetical protein